jgi:hypothetical protein
MSEQRPRARNQDGDQTGTPRAEDIEHHANVNQVDREPMPASHSEDRRQAAVVQNERAAAASAPGGSREGADGSRDADDPQDPGGEPAGDDSR